MPEQKAVVTRNNNAEQGAQGSVLSIFDRMKVPTIQKRFDEVLGKRAPGFISSVASAVKGNPSLKLCDPNSVISSALIAATLDLPINPMLGFAYMVPFNNLAQCIIGWKGLVQLVQRSGQTARIEISPVYDGQLTSWDPIRGDFEYDLDGRTNDKVIGYVAYFRLINGFEKYLYWTVEKAKAHGKRYSPMYKKNAGLWVTDFDAMAMKTVLRQILRFAPMTSDMELALRADQGVIQNAEAVINDGEDFDIAYPDFDSEVEDAEVDESRGTAALKNRVAKTKIKVDSDGVVTEEPEPEPEQEPEHKRTPEEEAKIAAYQAELEGESDPEGTSPPATEKKSTKFGGTTNKK